MTEYSFKFGQLQVHGKQLIAHLCNRIRKRRSSSSIVKIIITKDVKVIDNSQADNEVRIMCKADLTYHVYEKTMTTRK
ncbi:MAG TPA: hypothetical protein VIH27_02840 [Nitrososphaerales archaeon]